MCLCVYMCGVCGVYVCGVYVCGVYACGVCVCICMCVCVCGGGVKRTVRQQMQEEVSFHPKLVKLHLSKCTKTSGNATTHPQSYPIPNGNGTKNG